MSKIFLTPKVCYFPPEWATLEVVIRFRGAASISMGRTSHEVHDEMCRALGR